ncbi:O-antigen ligase domain-containing protein [candidate division WWE3 bacterium]|jgi:hypothetical protein|uniref:O-antigen ligase domain-containing protein n=1 Tax=candidate division WWE3 bacterium TaxID=2053526 RepID=A0A3A4ZC94_UNCKA|nr:MAG: O-antigen ligase domain-containing protein [candidate division WWE3 bacterium]
MRKLSKFLFFSLLAALPVNLGYHFIITQAYAGGLLIDYLIPTIFLPDIVATFLIGAWALERNFKNDLKSLLSKRYFAIAVWFLFVMFLSLFMSNRFLPSATFFTRTFLYTGVMLYASLRFDYARDLKIYANIIAVTTLALGILGILQYSFQGSVFDNYLILGEQPYSANTPSISKENVLGHTKVPAYGLFRHPNIFGGILSIYLVIIVFLHYLISPKIFRMVVLFGSFALLFTFSYFSWISFGIGLLIYFLGRTGTFLARAFVLSAFVFSFFIPVFRFLSASENPSIYRRSNLLDASYKIVKSDYLFGVGINNSVVLLEKNIPWTRDIRFVQPVHNIYALLVLEIGIIGLLLFLSLFYTGFSKLKSNTLFLQAALLQIIFLGCFDHYFVTIHQPWLLLWLTLGIVLNVSDLQDHV